LQETLQVSMITFFYGEFR